MSIKQTWTPGQWQAHGCSIEGPDTSTGRMRVIAVCTPAAQSIESSNRARANARLISKCPEMIEALQLVVADINDSNGMNFSIILESIERLLTEIVGEQ